MNDYEERGNAAASGALLRLSLRGGMNPIGETGEKWAIILESTLKIRKKLVISVPHKTIALPINILNSAMFLVIFSMGP